MAEFGAKVKLELPEGLWEVCQHGNANLDAVRSDRLKIVDLQPFQTLLQMFQSSQELLLSRYAMPRYHSEINGNYD